MYMSILIGSICFLVPIGSSSLSKGKVTAEGDDGDDEDANPPKEQRMENVKDIGNNKYR